MINTQQIKDNADLMRLADRYTELNDWTSNEFAGPCPNPRCTADENGFHVHKDGWWNCYTCHPKHGDVIDFVLWMGLAPDFQSACTWLAGSPVAVPKKRRPRAPTEEAWKSSGWQATARQEVAEAIKALLSPAGEVARAYLSHRGLLPETWLAWRMGWAQAWDGRLGSKRGAILIPGEGQRSIAAIKYRFIEDDPTGLRYTSKHGSQPLLFGLHLAHQHFRTLFLVEGEFNAASIWQALRSSNYVNFDALSFGSEGQADNSIVVDWANRYEQVIVWSDKAEVARMAARRIPRSYLLRSPEYQGRKLDANALLQDGALAEFLRLAWNRFDEMEAESVQYPVPDP
jgi:hypothetical protein